MEKNRKENIAPLLLIPSIFVTDFFVKKYVEQYGEKEKGKKFFGNRLQLAKHHNSGIMMDFFSDKTEWVLVVSSIMVTLLCVCLAVLLPKKGKKLMKYGLSFLIGGATGNLYDRAAHHYVVDYARFQTGISAIDRIIFNFSDLCIMFGIVMLAVGDVLSEGSQFLS